MIHLEEGKVYRRQDRLHRDMAPWEADGFLWVYVGRDQQTIHHQFKSVATGRDFFCVTPYIFFEGAER